MHSQNAVLHSAFHTVRPTLLTAALCLILLPGSLRADDDLRILELYNGPQTEIVSGNRSPRPASQTAENITVVTSSEIEALNAHTLADILYTVTGVQLEMNRTPGTAVNIEIQGSNFNHVLVLLDNVPINNLADNFPDLSSVPAQIIDRIEVVKGAASTSWGSALGGIINVITKNPDTERAFGGGVSASLGNRETFDGRGEISGSLNRVGYYLTAGRLRSDGLLPNNNVLLDSFYGKLQYALPVQGSLTLTTSLTEGSSGQVALPVFNAEVDQENRNLLSTLALQYPLPARLTLDASLRTRQSTNRVFVRNSVDGSSLMNSVGDDSGYGGSLKLTWIGDWQMLVTGVDYDHVRTDLTVLPGGGFPTSRADRIGFYLNDTITLGDVAITPSARFDRTGSGGDHFSPSLGITYAITENSLLRGYSSKGYSLTSLNRSSSTEKVWTSQLGFETGDLPKLWLKGTLFRNDTWDVNTDTPGGTVEQRELKRGFEVEARTLPFFNTSLSTGYTFIRGTRGEHGRTLSGIPKHTLQIGVRYQDPSDLLAMLTGHYVNWSDEQQARSGAVIWDLHVRKKVPYGDEGSLELFFSIRNLFNDDQYLNPFFENPGRWGEAGVRCNF